MLPNNGGGPVLLGKFARPLVPPELWSKKPLAEVPGTCTPTRGGCTPAWAGGGGLRAAEPPGPASRRRGKVRE